MARLLDVRPHDRRNTILAFLTLFALMVGHAILETARDALFLAKIPASHLPWAYIAIAAIAVVMTAGNRHCCNRLPRRGLLSGSLLVAAVATAGMWLLTDGGSSASLYLFYIWTGVIATVVAVQFWLLLSDMFTVSSAKRVYALIGAGGSLGAVSGAALAGALLTTVEPRALLLIGAAVFAFAAAGPMLLRDVAAPEPPSADDDPARQANLKLLRTHPYLHRLFLLVLIGSITVTVVDYLFKSVVADAVAPNELGLFFARYYAGLNGLAFVIQLLGASWLLRTAGVNRTLLLMPALLFAGAAGFLVAPVLVVALILKGADGGLRHSVNRTGMELLYIPLSAQIRHRLKGFMDTAGQRGGQAIASVAILAAGTAGARPVHLALAVLLLAAAWIVVLAGIHKHYLELFWQHLRSGSIERRKDLPELDLHTLESLVAGLSSASDAEVVSALDMFDAHGKAHLLPALILYHPSTEVVQRALELLVPSGRTDFVPIARRLLDQQDNSLRAAALRAITAVTPDEQLLRAHTADGSARVRATALVGLLSAGYEHSDQSVRTVIEQGGPRARAALARAIRCQPTELLVSPLLKLAQDVDPEVQGEAARAMLANPDPSYLPLLVEMCGRRRVRSPAREAIFAVGPDALDYLEQALADEQLPLAQRRHLPRTISLFRSQRAAEILLSRLGTERDGMTRFKILRGLGRMLTENPRLGLDHIEIRRAAHATLRRIVQLLAWRLDTEADLTANPAHLTPGSEMLLSLLAEKQANAVERLFRLLDLLRPRENFRLIFSGITSHDANARASGRELLEHTVDPDIRPAVLALVDDISDAARLQQMASFHAPAPKDYAERLRAMLDDRSEALRSIAAYHIGELGLSELQPDLEQASAQAHHSSLRDVVDHALHLLAGQIGAKVPHAT